MKTRKDLPQQRVFAPSLIKMLSSDIIKRVVDIVISLLAIFALAPLMLLTALLVWVNLGRPILFSQTRPGLHGKPFKLCKFRSMHNGTDSKGEPLPDEHRITEFGVWLRRTSLDELPSLFNVLKGEMSLVGPRPLLMEYLALYSEDQKKRHDVRPGITGLAQVSGRNNLSWNEKFDRDIEYVNSRSFLFDLSVILKTLSTVFGGKGISSGGAVGMEKFTGSASALPESEGDSGTLLTRPSQEV